MQLKEGTVIVYRRDNGELDIAEIFSYEEDDAIYDKDTDTYVAGYKTLHFGWDGVYGVLEKDIIKVIKYKGEE